jgi:glycosyltransferase involved in cell wall biosynthesis
MIELLFIQSQSFFGADTELHVQLMRYLDRQNVHVHVALTDQPSEREHVDLHKKVRAISDVKVVDINFGRQRGGTLRRMISRPAAMVAAIFTLRRYVRANGIRVVHGTEKPRDAFTAVILGKLTGARSVVHAHVSFGTWMSPLVKWSLRHADAVIAVSDFTRASLVRAGTCDQRAFEVRNALDIESGRWDDGDRQAIRSEFGIADDVVLIGVVSRLFSYKGHLHLLDALAAVDAEMPPYRLLIVGEDDQRGDPTVASFSEQIKESVRRQGLDDRVIMAGFRTDVPDLMSAFDIYAMPSWEEPFGMVYVEAMALRKPVIAWDIAGPTEIVVDGETGYLVEPRNEAALSSALLRLARDPALRERFGAAGRERVLAEFTSKRMAADVLGVYEAVLAMPKRGWRHC